MEKLSTIIRNKRKSNESKYRALVEDYEKKAQERLKAYLEKFPEKAAYEFFSIPIVSIDFEQETVKISDYQNYEDNVWIELSDDFYCDEDEDDDYNGYYDFKRCELCKRDYLLKNIDPEELQPLIVELKKHGYMPVYRKDETLVYPFFQVK